MRRKPKRTTYEQMFSILEEAKDPISKTKLSRRAVIMYNKFQVMCQFLEEKGFLERVVCDKYERMNGMDFKYRITLKGLDELRAHRDGYESHAIYRFGRWMREHNITI